MVSSSEGRDAEYDQFPSELVNQVIVYKTVDAGVVGQGLAGTIDIRPLMPLSLDKRVMSFNARGEHNTNGALSSTGNGANSNRFSASLCQPVCRSHDWPGDRLCSPGFARQHKSYQAWAYGDYVGQWGAGATGVPTVGSGTDHAVFQQGFESDVTASKQVRDGAMAVLQFKPNDRFTSTVDLYYSKFKQDHVGHHWVGDIGLWNGGPTADPPQPSPSCRLLPTSPQPCSTAIRSSTAER